MAAGMPRLLLKNTVKLASSRQLPVRAFNNEDAFGAKPVLAPTHSNCPITSYTRRASDRAEPNVNLELQIGFSPPLFYLPLL